MANTALALEQSLLLVKHVKCYKLLLLTDNEEQLSMDAAPDDNEKEVEDLYQPTDSNLPQSSQMTTSLPIITKTPVGKIDWIFHVFCT
jgi:hypothetical protein